MFVALNWKFFLVDLTSRKEVAVCLDTNLSLRIVLFSSSSAHPEITMYVCICKNMRTCSFTKACEC